MLAPYPPDRLHNQHPPPPGSRQSGQPIKPEIGGSILHAETQLRRGLGRKGPCAHANARVVRARRSPSLSPIRRRSFGRPIRSLFAYAGPLRMWAQRWKKEERLPEAIRETLLDASRKQQPASTIVRLKHTARGVAKREAQANASPPLPGQTPTSADQNRQ